jgi:hypothetical protein
MRRSRSNPWFDVSLDAWRLAIEASAVIGLRTLKIAAGGPAGQAEARLMVDEKIAAGFDLQAKAISGGLGGSPAAAASATLAHYQRKVTANRRRLLKVG